MAGEQVYKAWVSTVNGSGGIDGHPIDLITKDDASVPGNSVTAAQSLISTKVAAIVDNSLFDEAWASTVQKAKIPVVGDNLGNAPFYENPDFYPEGETEDSIGYAATAVGKEAGATKLAYFYCAESPSCAEGVAIYKAGAAKVGVSIPYTASIAATAPNYTAQCVAAQQAHVQAIMNGDADQVFERAASNCSQQGYHPIYVSSGESYEPSMLTATGVKDNAWYQSNNLPQFAANPAVKAMIAAVNKYDPGLVGKPNLWSGGASTMMWASGLLLEDAVKAGGLAPTGTPSAAEVVSGLAALKGDTLDGLAPPLTFVAGQPHPVHCWFTFRVQNGKPTIEDGGKVSCQNGPQS